MDFGFFGYGGTSPSDSCATEISEAISVCLGVRLSRLAPPTLSRVSLVSFLGGLFAGVVLVPTPAGVQRLGKTRASLVT